MKQKTFFRVFERLSSGEKMKNSRYNFKNMFIIFNINVTMKLSIVYYET